MASLKEQQQNSKLVVKERDDVAMYARKGFKVLDNSKFSMSTLHRWFSHDEDSNVLERLKRLREVEKKIVVAAGGENTSLNSSARDKVSRQAMSMSRKHDTQLVGDANKVLMGR